MKILSFADYHIGVKTHGKTDPTTGLNTRELQTLKVLDEMVDYAIEKEIKVMVAAGDMYKNSLPSPTLQEEFNKRIVRAAKAGINVLILDGNHDVSKMSQMCSPLKPFSTFQIDNVWHTRCHAEVKVQVGNERVKFVFLPTYHTKEEIEDICKNTVYDGDPIIFIGHMTIKNALLNDWLVEDKEIFVDAEAFDRPGVAAAILGHLHKHQILSRSPLVFYTGSTQRIDFNEERQEKGFVVLDVDMNSNVKHEYVEIESQKFCTLKFSLEGDENATNKILQDMTMNEMRIKDAIVRVQIELDEVTKLDEKRIYEYAYELGAANILNLQKKNMADKALRNSELTEHVSIEKGLELYYKSKPRGEQRIKLGKDIIRQSGVGEK